MLCRFLEEFCHGHLSLAGSLGLPECSLLALCVSCLAWCRGGLPLFTVTGPIHMPIFTGSIHMPILTGSTHMPIVH